MKPFTRSMRPHFEDLVECIYCVCQGEDHPTLHTRWRLLKHARRWPDIPLSIDRDDIRTELWLVWEALKKKYQNKNPKPPYTLESYICGWSPYEIKDKLRRYEMHYISLLEYVWNEIDEMSEVHEDQKDERLGFLMGGGCIPSLVEPFSTYERYLIYLVYVENKSIRQMAHILHKDRAQLGRTMKIVDEKIRRLANGFRE